METLRSTILEMYEKAEDRVVKKLQKKGYLTYQGFEHCLQIEFNKLERYYMKKHEVDPFSEEFVELVFDEYEHHAKSELGLKTLIPPDDEPDWMEGGLIGLDKDALEKAYIRLKRRIQKE
jgi:hypothetical protein